MVHRSGPIGPPERVPGLQQAVMQEPRPVWWEGTNGADINTGLNGQHTILLHLLQGLKGMCLQKTPGFDSPAGRWVGVALDLAS